MTAINMKSWSTAFTLYGAAADLAHGGELGQNCSTH